VKAHCPLKILLGNVRYERLLWTPELIWDTLIWTSTGQIKRVETTFSRRELFYLILSPTGFAVPQLSTLNGRRSSTYTAFLKQSKSNLFIATHALAEKVYIDESKRAYAVQFNQHGHRKVVRAKKEIVISAGAIGSPQILMLSGIGPKNHLQSLGVLQFSFIEPKIDGI
jgi:choline dehydrogenase-like flavoprotein